jgi:hypothetical protein
MFEPSKAQENPDMIRIALYWHQLSGVHALLRMLFGPDPDPEHCLGALIMDEVGLGKTFLATTLIIFLTDLVMRQKLTVKVPMPPIIGEIYLSYCPINFAQFNYPCIDENPYVCDSTSLPNLPQLIIVPGTLLSQWDVEMKSLIKGNTLNILLYGTGKNVHDRFWAEDGPFHKSTCSGAEVIIIASHSVRLLTTLYAAVTYTMFQALQQDFSLLYAWTKPKGETLPWTDPHVLPTYNALAPKTLYGRSYLSVTIDKAHRFRDIGAKHSSALLILKRSTF